MARWGSIKIQRMPRVNSGRTSTRRVDWFQKTASEWALRQIRYKTWLWAGILLLLPWLAHATGLGKLTILSALGQPLRAEVDLLSVQEGALATLKARIAAPETYTKANVQYSPALVGVRLSIERRSDGRPYIKIISTRPVNEPFIDLLVELSWEQGQLVREYTALIDPPGYTPGAPIVQAEPPVELAPAVTPEPQALAPTAPVEAQPAAKAPAVTRPAAPAKTPESQALAPTAPVKAKPAAKTPAVTRPAAPAGAGSKEYGPVKRGDTLSKIAARVKPKGVTLEQMLVSLYHANRDAFGGNMNLLYAGKILRIPEEPQVVAIAQSKAVEEVRVQEAGKETPREVLKLSKGELTDSGETGNGKGASRRVTERLRKLEAEVDALEKALTDANELVVQLEQTIKKMRRRIADAEQPPGISAAGTLPQPALGAKPGAAPPVKGDRVAKLEPARAESAKTEPATKMEPAKDADQMTAKAPGSDEPAAPAAQPAAAGPPQGEVLKVEAPKAGAGAPTQAAPTPAKIVQAPPYSIIDQIVAEPLYLGGGLLALLGGAGYWFTRRRGMRVDNVEPRVANVEPRAATVDPRVANVEPRGATVEPGVATVDPLAATVDARVATVDLLAEAKLFLKFGRDERAEEILIEVLEGDPTNEEAELKLLEIYAGRKDKAAFEEIARNLHTQTMGAGDNWIKTAAMGYAFDPDNRLYEAGPTPAMPAARGAATSAGADVELPPPASAETETAKLDAGAVNSSRVAQLGKMARPVETQDIARDAGAAHAAAEAAPEFAALDITLDFPDRMQPPAAPDKTPAADEAAPEFAALDITLDFPDKMQPRAAPDKTPAAPGGEAVKTGATGDPAAPMIGTIDFESTVPAPAPSGDGKDSK